MALVDVIVTISDTDTPDAYDYDLLDELDMRQLAIRMTFKPLPF